MTRRWSPALWAAVGFGLLILSLSKGSIDQMEAQTWSYARLGTFQEFCHELRTDNNSQSEMPLGVFSAWAWSKAFGTTEVAMRSLNLLWAAIALAALAGIGKRISIPWLPMLFAIQPFVWYSMNTARTPVMEMAGGSLLLAGAVAGLQRRPVDSAASLSLCLGALLLGGASLLGLIPLAAVAMGLGAHGLWNRLRWPRPGKFILLITFALIAVLGVYDRVLILRERGTPRLWNVSPANLCFVCYEVLGLQGLDPGRQELRSIMKGLSPIREFLPCLPGMVLLLGAYLLVVAAAAKSWLTRDPAPSLKQGAGGSPSASSREAPAIKGVSLLRVWLFGMGVSVQSAVFLFLLAVFTGVPFWGRHLAGAFPFWIVSLAIMIRWAEQGLWRKSGRRGGAVLIGILLVSSLLIRFLPQHRHDDYRGAAEGAKKSAEQGRLVWWVADHSGGLYYGLPFGAGLEQKPGEIVFAMNQASLSDPLPDVIVISRPDTFDNSGTVTKLLTSGKYVRQQSLQAFGIWERASP